MTHCTSNSKTARLIVDRCDPLWGLRGFAGKQQLEDDAIALLPLGLDFEYYDGAAWQVDSTLIASDSRPRPVPATLVLQGQSGEMGFCMGVYKHDGEFNLKFLRSMSRSPASSCAVWERLDWQII